MKEFIEKLIERLEEQQAEAENEMHRLRSGDYVLPCSYDITDIKEIASESFKESIEIVNELAEEYINTSTDTSTNKSSGWIACSERLPSKEEFLKDDGRFIVTDGNRAYATYFDIYDTLKFGEPTIDHFRVDKCVIAWQSLPAPYKEGE